MPDNKRNPATIAEQMGPVALVTSPNDGVRTSGTAFCVKSEETRSFLVTCRHVFTDLVDARSNNVLVNGYPAVEVDGGERDRDGSKRGADLCVLAVEKVKFTTLPIAVEDVSLDTKVSGTGFRHLHGDHYFSCEFRGKVDRLQTVRRQTFCQAIPSFRVIADQDFGFHPGLSGSPLCNSKNEVVGVIAFSSTNGMQGYALSKESIYSVIPSLSRAKKGHKAQGANRDFTEIPLPPRLPGITVEDDLQHGRFGGTNSDGFVTLNAELIRQYRKNYFLFNAVVKPVAGISLVGPARFYLHDTYQRVMVQILKVQKDGSMRFEEITSDGVYTLGCQVYCDDNAWHSVELDLKVWGASAGLDAYFLER